MCAVRPEFIDENSNLIEPDKLPEDYKMIYEEIMGIYNKIYFNGKDIDVFYWTVF